MHMASQSRKLSTNNNQEEDRAGLILDTDKLLIGIIYSTRLSR